MYSVIPDQSCPFTKILKGAKWRDFFTVSISFTYSHKWLNLIIKCKIIKKILIIKKNSPEQQKVHHFAWA